MQAQPSQDYNFGTAAPLAAQFGANMVQSTIGKYLPFASALWHSLRYYFDVNNSYVKNKLVVLLAPYRHKQWKRVSSEDSGSPIHDPNSAVRARTRELPSKTGDDVAACSG